MRCYYFGCWKEPGHYLWLPGGRSVPYDERGSIEYYGSRIHIDGTLAPCFINGVVGWRGMPAKDDRQRRSYESAQELRNGRFLRHVLDNGFSAISWWDQHQGDRRPGSSSTVLLEGQHDTATLLAQGREHFDRVFDNLTLAAGIELVEVLPGQA